VINEKPGTALEQIVAGCLVIPLGFCAVFGLQDPKQDYAELISPEWRIALFAIAFMLAATPLGKYPPLGEEGGSSEPRGTNAGRR
tara:strand:+ start:399 stop:653 length:255 start_codon:yes stop_codon:yes gene_type:complete